MIIQFQNRKFGASTDRIDIAKQPDLFNEAEAVIEQIGEVDEPTEVVVTRRKRGGRRTFPKSLQRVTIVHDIDEADKQCCECHQPMGVISVDRTEKLKYIPATLEVEVHERPKYGCKTCECAPKQAKPAPQAIPKGIATASLLAHVLFPNLLMPRHCIARSSSGIGLVLIWVGHCYQAGW
jgi:transposase